MSDQNESKKKIPFLAVMLSTAAAAIGVQSKKNRERDFSRGNPAAFIIGGILFALIFILSVYTVVQIVMSSAGAN